MTFSTSPVVWYSGGACITQTFATSSTPDCHSHGRIVAEPLPRPRSCARLDGGHEQRNQAGGELAVR